MKFLLLLVNPPLWAPIHALPTAQDTQCQESALEQTVTIPPQISDGAPKRDVNVGL